MSDLVERLRFFAKGDDGVSPYNADGPLVNEAADEIERLRAENSTLRNAQKACEHCMTPTYAELRAERDALRALLRRVLSCGLNEEPHGVGFTPSRQEKKAGELARDIEAALGNGG